MNTDFLILNSDIPLTGEELCMHNGRSVFASCKLLRTLYNYVNYVLEEFFWPLADRCREIQLLHRCRSISSHSVWLQIFHIRCYVKFLSKTHSFKPIIVPHPKCIIISNNTHGNFCPF